MLKRLQGIERIGQVLRLVNSNSSGVLLLLLTHGMSLRKWHELGLLDREILIYKRLVSLGWRIRIATFGDISEEMFVKDIDGIEVMPLYGNSWQARSWLSRFIVPIIYVILNRKQFEGISLVKTNQTWGGWIALLIKLMYKAPILARSGYDLFSFSCRSRAGIKMVVLSWLASELLYCFADRIHVATAEDQAALKSFSSSFISKSAVIPNWIDTARFRSDLGYCDKCFDVVAVGRLERQKGFDTLIESLAGTTLRCLIIGSGSEETALKGLALRLGSNVEFIDRVTNDQLPQFLKRSRIYCMTSHYEGCPKAMLEAMSMGLPIVAVDAPGVSNIINAAASGLLVQRSHVDIRQALLDLKNDNDRYNLLKAKGPSFIEKHYSLNAIVLKEHQALMALSGEP